MRSPSQLIEKFEALDVHDDMVEEIRFVPAAKPRTRAKVKVTLYRHWEDTRRVLTFLGCTNHELVLDADVLRDNSPSNTCSLEATADENEIAARMRRHKRAWNLSYERSIDPLPSKLSSANKLVLFRVRLFGGNIEVIARSFSIQRIRVPSIGD
jgi:hypothetical protein